MKKYIYSLMAVLMGTLCSAQVVSLSQAEYFWDTDPGEGNATAITASDGNYNSAFERIALTGLAAPSVGLHKFCVRVKDNTGVWSEVFTNVIRVEPTTTPTPVNLLQAEYFWDADPGEGSGLPMLAADGNFNSSFEKILKNGIPIVNPVGFHVFNARVKDKQGVWGPVFKNVVYIETVLSNNPVTQSHLTVYPNPVKNILNISLDNGITGISVYNLLGQEVLSRELNANEANLDVSNLRQGTYLVMIRSENKLRTIKIIKE